MESQDELLAEESAGVGTGAAGGGSFISASSGSAFSSRLLAVTAPVNRQARQIILKAEPRCEVLYGSDLDSWPVNWEECLEDPSRMRFAATPRHTPKLFQAKAVERVMRGLAGCDRGRLVLPCGTDKSVVSLWIAEKMVDAAQPAPSATRRRLRSLPLSRPGTDGPTHRLRNPAEEWPAERLVDGKTII